MIMKKVLIIDDDKIVREPIREYLTFMGYHVDVAKDGKAGIEMFRKTSDFDVVITDIEMPIMNGTAVANFIRASEKSKTYIVAISGSLESIRKKEMFDIVLPKPFPLKRLAAIIDNIQMKSMVDNCGRRLGIDRRRFSYFVHIPERRSGKERRKGFDRRRDKSFKIVNCNERRTYDEI